MTTLCTVVLFSLYDQVVLGNFPPTAKVEIEFYYWLALLGSASSLVAVVTLAQFRVLAIALFVTVAFGFVLAYGVGMISYGYEGELGHGLLFRAIGGGNVALVAVITAWIMRWILGRPGRKT